MFLTACMGDEKNEENSTQLVNLAQYGVPVSLPLPAEINVRQSPVSYEKGVIITDNNINMRVEALNTYADSSKDAEYIKTHFLDDKKEESDFRKVLLDEKQGFIYLTEDADLGNNYHFFFVMIKNNTQVEFTEGIPPKKNFSYEEITNMYSLSKKAL
ncbi:MAG: hypothetical protein K1X92_08760 [Bacteroidia bacterium]|nr:hypothetical protein [Bacteroidia bacterium]